MSKKKLQVVIGANYGDEGKGYMTDYFCARESRPEKGIVVLSNGGAQKGHTVSYLDKKSQKTYRHVFHHFGSGTFRGYATYFPKPFILNPFVFCKEKQELEKKLKELGLELPPVLCHSSCLWSTPYDAILNQIKARKKNQHNTCGLGIWETMQRLKNPVRRVPLLVFAAAPKNIQEDYLLEILRETQQQIHEEAVPAEILQEYQDFLDPLALAGQKLMQHFIQDCETMCQTVLFPKENTLADFFEHFVFENSQGLLLDEEYSQDPENSTPSSCGLKNPAKFIEKHFYNQSIEVCYVTRTYLTRHGDGELQTKELPGFPDATNIPNPFQGIMRTAELDTEELRNRITKDFKNYGSSLNNTYQPSLAMTHQNELDFPARRQKSDPFFKNIYISDGVTSECCRLLENASCL